MSNTTSRSYDVIIVGGGTAGCVLAARLSVARPDLRFLLLEAGPNNNDDVNVRTPLTSRRMFNNEKYDWSLDSVPQSGLNGRVIAQTRGRMLGGSSAINSHSLVYPNREMHDAWADLVHDSKWSWDGMRPYYERFQEVLGGPAASFHETGAASGGPIKASYPRSPNVLQKVWEQAFNQLNAVASTSPIDGHAIGGGTTTNAIDSTKGERSHAGIAYLASVLGRINLTVETGCLVERIVFDDEVPLRATGVRYRVGTEDVLAIASKEVILCGGVFGSPKLLELSGIGRSQILSTAGVEQLLELSGVGENLQDHLNYGPSVEVEGNIETLDSVLNDATLTQEQRRQYDEQKTGPLAEGAAYSFAYWPLQLFNNDADEASLKDLVESHKRRMSPEDPRRAQYEFIYDSLLSRTAASATVFMTRKVRYISNLGPEDCRYMSIIAMLSHPFSRGSTHIHSQNPAEPPTINPGYLQDELDVEILARHVFQLEAFLNLPAFRDIVLPQGRRFPRAFSKPPESPSEIKEAIRQYSATNYHPCGTAAMMDKAVGGVVDGNLRVYGTENLRICDASIFPIIPRGNILTTVYAVAEKAVDIILAEWELS